MVDTYRPSDPLLSSQWHLFDIGRLGASTVDSLSGLERIWADYTGAGVQVGIWDDGVDRSHWDLAANYDASLQVSVSGRLNDGLPDGPDAGHGTAVAGLIAADDNGRGGVGVAFDATITSVRIFGGADDINTYWNRYLSTLDSLSRFDVTNHSYGSVPDFYVYGDVAKFEASLRLGRDGLGTINIKSAGNSNIDQGGVALDASRATVNVAALDGSGQAASYSSYGAHVLVSAPAGSVTTDRRGTGSGYDGLEGGDYTNRFGGTSAAAPITAGVATLMLEANAGLGWRDVQNILAHSAVGTGSLISGVKTNENGAWVYNGSSNWNGGGLHYSVDYGYGMVNAHAAVRMAEVWTVLNGGAATSANEVKASTGTMSANRAIPDKGTLTYSFTVGQDIDLEHVGLTVSFVHPDMKSLRMTLVSPDGTEMTFYNGSSGMRATASGGLSYTFGLEGFRGEGSAGTWKLIVTDTNTGETGTLRSVGFTGYGAAATVNDVYHYTDEVLTTIARAGQGGRIMLADASGNDWINASSMYRALVLNLNEGATSTLGGTAFLTIAAGTVIERAIGGDGDDRIIGNQANNTLAGMRGNDTLEGGAGTDTALFFGDLDAFRIVAANGIITVTSLLGGYGIDVLIGFEFARFDDLVMDLTAMFSDRVAPTLVAMPAHDDPVRAESDLVLHFSEWVMAGTGDVVIRAEDGTVVARIDITDETQVSVNGRTVTIDPAADLGHESRYYITFDAGAVVDMAGNASAAFGSLDLTGFETRPEPVVVEGDNQANTLRAATKDTILRGFGGGDILQGEAGDDVLNGGIGIDTMVGGEGDDLYYINLADDRIVERAGQGIDTVRADFGLTLQANVENLVFTATGNFRGVGNGLDNQIRGAAGAENLIGRAGQDTLIGGAGDDRLSGGRDADRLWGDGGADAFVFAAARDADGDTIMDFESGADRIRLDRIDANTQLAGDQSFLRGFVQDFTGRCGELRVKATENGVSVAGDVDGDGVADFQFAVLGLGGLTSSDFLL